MSAPNSVVNIGPLAIGNAKQLAIIAGPCQLESRAHALEMASALKEIAAKAGVGLIYKTSFDKANRTSGSGKRGIGLHASLPIFAEIRDSLGLPVLTDVHEREQCALVASAVDVLQIPAFLSRQTDLLIAEAKYGAPVVMDATHAGQKPGGQGASSGGNRDMAPYIARAAVAVGVAAVFMETHQDPDNAPSDGPNMIRLKDMPAILGELVEIDRIAKKRVAG